jgi:hypothetical protein
VKTVSTIYQESEESGWTADDGSGNRITYDTREAAAHMAHAMDDAFVLDRGRERRAAIERITRKRKITTLD